jgi:hypothetical protein
VNGSEAGACDGVYTHDPCLQLGDLSERGIDAVLDGTNLGCDFIGGVFNLMLTHDCSFPREGESRGNGCRKEKKVGFR